MNKGAKHSPATCAAMSAARTAWWSVPDNRAAAVEKLKRRRHSPETRAKMSAAHRGRRQSQEAIEKVRAANLGRPLSAEHREKLRQAKLRNPVRYWLGKFRPTPSAVTRAKMSVVMKGRRPSGRSGSKVTYNGVQFLSGWEARVAAALDALGVRWEYEPRRFDLGTQVYTPDFYLPDEGCFWEVKGYYGPKSQRTVELFRACFPEIPLVLVTECVLKMVERSAAAKAA